LLIHATNITGLGASHVVTSFIDAACELNLLKDSVLYLPAEGPLARYSPKQGRFNRYKRSLPNSISRLVECFFGGIIFPKEEITIVLGDIPLRGVKNQIVLVHQPNLVCPKVNSLSGKSLTFKILRFIFKMNLKYAKHIVVQTGVMKREMLESYPKLKGRISIMPQPLPNWFQKQVGSEAGKQFNEKIILLYPAAGYSHKNHEFLLDLYHYCKEYKIDMDHIEIRLTLTEDEYSTYKSIPFIKNLGRLDPKGVNSAYGECDGLLFLSKMESYGLPLVEALYLSLPIVTIDLPYSRWMCEDEAYYFNNNSCASFLKAVGSMDIDRTRGQKPNYSEVLLKFPDRWEDVVQDFLSLEFS
jgi:glycosyltransferase involved in cell wall biosynthesis